MSSRNIDAEVTLLRQALETVAVTDDAEPMARYLKNQYPFLGVKAGPRRAAAKSFMAGGKGLDEAEILATARACWHQPEREFHYVGADWLRRWVAALTSPSIEDIAWFITTHSWWDTVDTLATRVVGPMVAADAHLVTTMDRWIDDDNMWLARTAILHQLNYKADTDIDRLFAYCLHQADHSDFFIRKAIGWALRQQARHTPDLVATFVADHTDRLSPLSRREATLHLGTG